MTDQMNRKQALEILELSPEATTDDVSKRYGILTRKFRDIKTDDRGYTITDITRAYNLLMGITYIDKQEQERQKKLRENPPFLARILKVDPIKLENFFNYYSLHMLVGLIAIVITFFSIRSCVNQIPADFSIIFHGRVFCEDQVPVENDVKERLPGIEAPSIQFLSSVSEDPQYQYATQMKFVAMIAAQELDVAIMDKETFEFYAGQGVFLPLDDILDKLGFPEERYVIGQENIGETENMQPIKGPEQIFGIDITDNSFINDNKIYIEEAIVAIVRNTQKMDRAMELVLSFKN